MELIFESYILMCVNGVGPGVKGTSYSGSQTRKPEITAVNVNAAAFQNASVCCWGATNTVHPPRQNLQSRVPSLAGEAGCLAMYAGPAQDNPAGKHKVGRVCYQMCGQISGPGCQTVFSTAPVEKDGRQTTQSSRRLWVSEYKWQLAPTVEKENGQKDVCSGKVAKFS